MRLPFSLWMTEQVTPVPERYLAANPEQIAPVWVGEFGNDVDWCWWALNPTQPQGTIPVAGRHRSNWGDPEPWGLLAPDWRGLANPDVLDLLRSLIPPGLGP